MSVLAIETATSVCAAAVVQDGRVLAESSVNRRFVHAERLMGLIDEVMQKSAIKLSGLDAVAVSIGPGSFTGLRIGLSAGKGIAYGLSKPIVSVPTLEALASRIAGTVPDGDFILSALDARRDEVYCQLFKVQQGNLAPVWQERAMSINGMLTAVDNRRVNISGDAREKIKAAMTGVHPGVDVVFAKDDLSLCSAGSVGLLGEQLLLRGCIAEASTLEPRYIKEFFTVTA